MVSCCKSLLGSNFISVSLGTNLISLRLGSLSIDRTVGPNYLRTFDKHHVHITQFMQGTVALTSSIFGSFSFLVRDDFNSIVSYYRLLAIKHCIDFKIANIAFRILHSSQPAYLRSSLHACHSTRSFRLSNTNLLSAPFVRTSFGSLSFSIAAPTIWNSILVRVLIPFVVTSRPTTGLLIHLTPLLLRLRFGFC